ncbi:MAG: methyltransferase domain-containing protein [Desulfatiglans sp.]|nr:methyltransferase domain-containing protein [Desulfatiglans sp.]
MFLKKLFKRHGSESERVECPICGYRAELLKTGGKVGKCPNCITYARHRLIAFWLKDHFDRDSRISVLHVAPEPGLKRLFLEKFPHMTYTDIDNGEGESADVASRQIDLCDLPYEDDHFDLSICSHVLEHIQDDRKAISELFRVMKPGGQAIIMLPIFNNLAETIEDPKIVSPRKRKKIFGQSEHVRKCGVDYWDRIHEAGFKRAPHPYSYKGTDEEAEYYQMTEGSTERDFENKLDLFVK